MSKDRYYEKRWYDGEQEFVCAKCDMREVDYLFDDEDPSTWHTAAGDFFSKQQPPRCPVCHEYMNWSGYSGSTTDKQSIAGAILELLRQEQYLAVCIVFSSATEYQLNSLLWAALVDYGYEKDKAAQLADGSLSNGEVVRLLRVVLARNLKTIVLPARNDMVHGREFGNSKDYFIAKLDEMRKAVAKWATSFDHHYKEGKPSETDRWFLYMRHWLAWCDQRFPKPLATKG